MEKRVITMDSQTSAIKAQRVLSSGGIRARVVKLKAGRDRRECTHGVQVAARDEAEALDRIGAAGISYTGVEGF